MELPIVSALEFEQLKSSIKTFIKTKTDFKDYDFEGSNLSMLVDILAYNTLYTSYNVSMASNELNLDTAVLRDNVVSIAKRLGYNPSSYTSSKVTLDITVNNIGLFDSVSIEPGTVLSSSLNGKNYVFIIRDRLEVDVRGRSSVNFSDVEVIEGSDFSITYTVDTSNENQRFFIPNNFVDVSTIRAFVISDPTTNIEEEYEKKFSIVDVSASSKIFFVEEVQDQKYEVIFGDDVFGRQLKNGEVIRLQYVVSSGAESNSIRNFNFAGTIKGRTNNLENIIGISDIVYNIKSEFSDGGSEFESIRSIKFAAPRKYAAQERAVTLSDYESILRQIYTNADLVKVVGGESFKTPRFGKVYIAIKPLVGEKVSFSEKERIKRELKKYQVGSITTEVIDPDFLNIFITPVVLFDTTKTRRTIIEIKSLVNSVILKYIKDPSFNSFGGTYSNSKLTCDLREIDSAIKFVGIRLFLRKSIDIFRDIETRYEVSFDTKLKNNTQLPFYILSDPFCVVGIPVPVVIGAAGNCDESGDLNLYTTDGRFIRKVGTVNNAAGELEFTVRSCQDDPINITVIPEITEIVTGPATTPEVIVDDIIVSTDFDDTDPLDPGTNEIPIDEITNQPAEGDTTTTTQIPTEVTPAPSGAIPPVIPSISQVTPISTISDQNDPLGGVNPNDVTTIDDFTPETNPNSCS